MPTKIKSVCIKGSRCVGSKRAMQSSFSTFTLYLFGCELKVQVYCDDEESISIDLLTTLYSIHKAGKSISHDTALRNFRYTNAGKGRLN